MTKKVVILLSTWSVAQFAFGQVMVENSELLKLNIKNIYEHPYFKAFKGRPKKTNGFSMSKPIDGPCYGGAFTQYYFRKGKTRFYFDNNHSKNDTQYVTCIRIDGRNSPLFTQDSLGVGSKTKIGNICNDISRLKKYATDHRERFVDFHRCRNVTYYFKKIPVSKLSEKSKIRITRIYIDSIR